MKKIYSVSGLHCDACVRRVQNALSGLPGMNQVTVDLVLGTVTIISKQPYDTAYLNSVLEDFGNYVLSEKP